jgi:hypothetical protein
LRSPAHNGTTLYKGGSLIDIATHSATLISIVIGLGMTEMFGNLYRLIRNRSRVRWTRCRSPGWQLCSS